MLVKIKLLIVIISQLLLTSGIADCQDKIIPEKKVNDFFVNWKKTISAQSLSNNGKKLATKIKNFLFGNSSINLIRPVNVTSLDSNILLILDQGLNYPVSVNISDNDIKSAVNDETFPSLLGICRWKDSKILFTDSKLNKIFVYNPEKKDFKSFSDEKLLQPTGIAYNPKKQEVWISETGNHRLLIMDDNGKIKKIIGSRGKDKSEFNFPTYMWIDKNGETYVVDAMNFRIQIFSSDGLFLSMFGETGDAPGYLSAIKGLATDSYGHIYIVDALFNVVQIFDKNGTFLYNFGGPGKENGQFYKPMGIFIDSYDNIYVADSYNSRIQIFSLQKGNN